MVHDHERLLELVDRAAPLPYTPSGSELKRLRRNAGLTREDFGALVGVKARSVENWEQSVARPQLHTTRRLRAVLAVLANATSDPSA